MGTGCLVSEKVMPLDPPDLYGICDYCGETNWVYIGRNATGEKVHICKRCKQYWR